MEKINVEKLDLSSVKVGDEFVRVLAGVLRVPVVVGEVSEEYFWVGTRDKEVPGTKDWGWKFRKDLGTEVDEDLNCDGKNFTLSFLER